MRAKTLVRPIVSLAALAAIGAAAISAKSAPTSHAIKYATTLQGRSANQRHNALLACAKLNGAVIAPGAVFSFNRRVGSWSRDAGYRRAPVSYNGTLIDAWGGGVCQASTTLYNAALLAGMDVLERHPHRFAPSYCPPGRDAAVAFSGVDLRFKNPHSFPLKLHARFEGDQLTISLAAQESLPKSAIVTDVRGFAPPKEHRIARGGNDAWVRNAGKPGWEVITYRLREGRREWIASDSYPTMDRIVEFR